MNIIIGRVTKDLEAKTSGTGVTYVNFDVAENLGFGEKAKQYFTDAQSSAKITSTGLLMQA